MTKTKEFKFSLTWYESMIPFVVALIALFIAIRSCRRIQKLNVVLDDVIAGEVHDAGDTEN